jgi:hypothetical protein
MIYDLFMKLLFHPKVKAISVENRIVRKQNFMVSKFRLFQKNCQKREHSHYLLNVSYEQLYAYIQPITKILPKVSPWSDEYDR